MMGLINDELERMWKEAVLAYLKVQSRPAPGGSKKYYRNS
jgi:hypothetical protein